MNKPVSVVKRIFSGLWRFITLTRTLIVNLVFFVLLIAFIGVLSNGEEQIVVPNSTALVVNLVGDIVEQKREINPVDAFLQEALDEKEDNPEILLTDVLNVITQAKNDDRVKLLVLQLQGLNSTGLTKLQDIGKALQDFKDSGKQIIALGDQFTQDQYYLASTADEVWLNPEGFMLLDGYGSYSLYFKSALEKLAISQHIFRVGTFKSAVEPFIRDDMSAAAKEANKLWLADLWLQYKDDVAQARGFSIENFDESIDELVTKFSAAESSFAQYALENNWVDALKTRAEMRNKLITLVGKNKKGDSYRHIGFKDYLVATTVEQNGLAASQPMQVNADKVAIIVAKGAILNGIQKPGTIGGDSTAVLLRKARNNDQVKAVVLRVDSPGGSAYASEIIRQEVELLKLAGKPVVASMGTYAASGGYWISAPADKIYAAPSTITGSIGIFGMMMTFEKTLSKLGIYTDGVGTTDIAGFGVTRPLSEGMGKLFQLSINKGYQDFITLVATNRDMTLAQVDAVAQGRVWSGKRAKELGLVDELGDLTDAVIAAADLAELKQYDTLLIEKESSSRNKFIQQLFADTARLMTKFTGLQPSNLIELTGVSTAEQQGVATLIKTLKTEFGALNQLNDPQGKYTLCLSCNAQ